MYHSPFAICSSDSHWCLQSSHLLKKETQVRKINNPPRLGVVMFRTLEANQVLRPISPISAAMGNAETQLAGFRTYSSSRCPPGTAGARSSASRAETTALTTVLERWGIIETCGDWEIDRAVIVFSALRKASMTSLQKMGWFRVDQSSCSSTRDKRHRW